MVPFEVHNAPGIKVIKTKHSIHIVNSPHWKISTADYIL